MDGRIESVIDRISYLGINSVIQYSVEKAVQSELEKHRKEVEQLMVSTKLNEEKIATDVKQINKMRSAFTEDKEALETSLNQIDGIKEKLNSTIAEGQTLELALRKAMSELHRIRSLTAVVTLTFERDISELTAEAFADIRVGNINMGTAPGLVESNVKQAQIALWHLGADSQDDDEMVALFVSVLDLICTKIIYHFILT